MHCCCCTCYRCSTLYLSAAICAAYRVRRTQITFFRVPPTRRDVHGCDCDDAKHKRQEQSKATQRTDEKTSRESCSWALGPLSRTKPTAAVESTSAVATAVCVVFTYSSNSKHIPGTAQRVPRFRSAPRQYIAHSSVAGHADI